MPIAILLMLNIYHPYHQVETENATAASQATGWKPLTRGVRLDKYTKAKETKRKRKLIKADSADDRIDIETSDNLQYLSVSKPDAAVKLEPQEVSQNQSINN